MKEVQIMRSPQGRATRSLVTAGLLALTCASIAACGGSGDARPSASSQSGSAQEATLRVALYPGTLDSLPVHIGIAEGIFKKHGLTISTVEVSSGVNATAALLSGSVDLELNTVDNNMLAHDQGKNIVAVSGNNTHSIFSLIVRKDYPTPNLTKGFPDSVRDLKGAKIGVVALGASVEKIARGIIKAAGLDPDHDVTFVATGIPPTSLPALQAGRTDALMAFEPAQTRAVDIGGFAKTAVDLRKDPLPQGLEQLNWPYNQWCSTAEVVKDKRAAMSQFQASMKEVFAFMQDPANFEKVSATAQQKIAPEPELVTKMLKTNLANFKFEIPQAGVEHASAFLQEVGSLKKAVSFQEYVDAGAR